MKAVTYQEIREKAESLPNAALVKSWLYERTGTWHTDKQLNDLLRGAIPKESDYQSRIIKWLNNPYPGAFVWKAAAAFASAADLSSNMQDLRFDPFLLKDLCNLTERGVGTAFGMRTAVDQ